MEKQSYSAFRPPDRLRTRLVRISPPCVHTTPYVTGGLQLLYRSIQQAGDSFPMHRFGSYTDDQGCFSPEENMPLLARRFKYIQTIGKGQSSVLIQAEDSFSNGPQVSIKVLHAHYSMLGAQEMDCLRRLNQADPLCVSATLRLYTTFTFDEHYCLVFELLHPRPLLYYFKGLHRTRKGLDQVRHVAVQMLFALGFLQNQNVIHADLKPENLLLKKEDDLKSLKVVDFGNSILCVHDELSLYYDDFELQTLLYRGPEVMLGLPFGMEVDIWSLGCILAELFLGVPLFSGKDKGSILKTMVGILGPLPQEIYQKGKFFNDFQHFSSKNVSSKRDPSLLRKAVRCSDQAFLDFLSGLLQYDPAERFTVSQAACHTFLAPALPLQFVMPSRDDKSSGYPTILVTPTTYTHRPFVHADVNRLCLNGENLLRNGTTGESSEQELKLNVRQVAQVVPLQRDKLLLNQIKRDHQKDDIKNCYSSSCTNMPAALISKECYSGSDKSPLFKNSKVCWQLSLSNKDQLSLEEKKMLLTQMKDDIQSEETKLLRNFHGCNSDRSNLISCEDLSQNLSDTSSNGSFKTEDYKSSNLYNLASNGSVRSDACGPCKIPQTDLCSNADQTLMKRPRRSDSTSEHDAFSSYTYSRNIKSKKKKKSLHSAVTSNKEFEKINDVKLVKRQPTVVSSFLSPEKSTMRKLRSRSVHQNLSQKRKSCIAETYSTIRINNLDSSLNIDTNSHSSETAVETDIFKSHNTLLLSPGKRIREKNTVLENVSGDKSHVKQNKQKHNITGKNTKRVHGDILSNRELLAYKSAVEKPLNASDQLLLENITVLQHTSSDPAMQLSTDHDELKKNVVLKLSPKTIFYSEKNKPRCSMQSSTNQNLITKTVISSLSTDNVLNSKQEIIQSSIKKEAAVQIDSDARLSSMSWNINKSPAHKPSSRSWSDVVPVSQSTSLEINKKNVKAVNRPSITPPYHSCRNMGHSEALYHQEGVNVPVLEHDRSDKSETISPREVDSPLSQSIRWSTSLHKKRTFPSKLNTTYDISETFDISPCVRKKKLMADKVNTKKTQRVCKGKFKNKSTKTPAKVISNVRTWQRAVNSEGATTTDDEEDGYDYTSLQHASCIDNVTALSSEDSCDGNDWEFKQPKTNEVDSQRATKSKSSASQVIFPDNKLLMLNRHFGGGSQPSTSRASYKEYTTIEKILHQKEDNSKKRQLECTKKYQEAEDEVLLL